MAKAAEKPKSTDADRHSGSSIWRARFVREVGKLVYGTDNSVMEIASKKTSARRRLKSE